jgi:hypothetical protein
MILPSGLSTTNYSRLANSKGWGSGWPNCQAANNFGIGQVAGPRSGATIQGGVNARIQKLTQLLVSESERRGYMLVKGWCWGYGCRAISGTNTPSNHSWGLAADINAPTNPYTSSGQHDIPDWMFALWRRFGYGVGADYSGRQDWMHFEFMGTPGDADIMTDLAVKEFGTEPGKPVPKPDWFPDVITREEWTAVVREAFPVRSA